MSGERRRRIINQVRTQRFAVAGDYSVIPRREDALKRDANVFVRTEQPDVGRSCFVIELDGEVFGLPEDDWRPMASVDLNRTKLCECVTVCRDKWRKVIEKQVEGPWWRSTA